MVKPYVSVLLILIGKYDGHQTEDMLWKTTWYTFQTGNSDYTTEMFTLCMSVSLITWRRWSSCPWLAASLSGYLGVAMQLLRCSEGILGCYTVSGGCFLAQVKRAHVRLLSGPQRDFGHRFVMFAFSFYSCVCMTWSCLRDMDMHFAPNWVRGIFSSWCFMLLTLF